MPLEPQEIIIYLVKPHSTPKWKKYEGYTHKPTKEFKALLEGTTVWGNSHGTHLIFKILIYLYIF